MGQHKPSTVARKNAVESSWLLQNNSSDCRLTTDATGRTQRQRRMDGPAINCTRERTISPRISANVSTGGSNRSLSCACVCESSSLWSQSCIAKSWFCHTNVSCMGHFTSLFGRVTPQGSVSLQSIVRNDFLVSSMWTAVISACDRD